MVGVRVLGAPAVETPSSQEQLQARYQTQLIEELQGACDDRAAQIAQLRKDIADESAKAYEEGRLAGLAAADDRQKERIALLSEKLSQAVDALRSEYVSMERLAVLLARLCLEKMFGESSDRVALVRDLIRGQIQEIDPATLLNVTVSCEDFASESALLNVAESLGLARARVLASPEMSSGDCEMTLTLGQLDLGLTQQWGVLSQALFAMADAGDIG